MGVIEWATSPWGQNVPIHIAWFLIWVAARRNASGRGAAPGLRHQVPALPCPGVSRQRCTIERHKDQERRPPIGHHHPHQAPGRRLPLPHCARRPPLSLARRRRVPLLLLQLPTWLNLKPSCAPSRVAG